MHCPSIKVVLVLSVATLVLTGCPVKSTQTPSDSINLRVKMVVDGDQKKLSTTVDLGVKKKGGSINSPVKLAGGDQLLLVQQGAQKVLGRPDDNYSYQASISPINLNPITLIFSRASEVEPLKSEITVPFALTNFSAEINASDAIVSAWQVLQLGGSTDHSKLPRWSYLISAPTSCINDTGFVEVLGEDRAHSLASLDAAGLASGGVSISRAEFLKAHGYLSTQLGYTECNFDLQLTADWSNNWDGVNEPKGGIGPVWIQPDPAFANETLSLRDQNAFSIEVISEIHSISISF